MIAYRNSFSTADMLCICMEHAPGGDLTALISSKRRSGERFTEGVVIKMAYELTSALAYFHHELHLLHRDLKPQNVFVASDGSMKLGDFGLSKQLAATNALVRVRVELRVRVRVRVRVRARVRVRIRVVSALTGQIRCFDRQRRFAALRCTCRPSSAPARRTTVRPTCGRSAASSSRSWVSNPPGTSTPRKASTAFCSLSPAPARSTSGGARHTTRPLCATISSDYWPSAHRRGPPSPPCCRCPSSGISMPPPCPARRRRL